MGGALPGRSTRRSSTSLRTASGWSRTDARIREKSRCPVWSGRDSGICGRIRSLANRRTVDGRRAHLPRLRLRASRQRPRGPLPPLPARRGPEQRGPEHGPRRRRRRDDVARIGRRAGDPLGEPRRRPPRPAPRHRRRPRAAAGPAGSRERRRLDPLPDRRRDRPRRHGRRAQGPRPRPRPRRGDQGPPRGPAREPRHGPPVRRGGPDRRPVAAPGDRADLRAGRLRRPPAVLLDEAGQGPHARRAARRPQGPGLRPSAAAQHR